MGKFSDLDIDRQNAQERQSTMTNPLYLKFTSPTTQAGELSAISDSATEDHTASIYISNDENGIHASYHLDIHEARKLCALLETVLADFEG